MVRFNDDSGAIEAMIAGPYFIPIRGYAIPFDRTMSIVGEGVEVVDRKAFDAMLAPKNSRVPLRWLEHDDDALQVASDVNSLFADDYGLGFSAVIDVRSKAGQLSANWSVLSAMTRSAKPLDQCSVGGLEIGESRADKIHGIACRRIIKAKISHITICDNAAYRQFTAVWRADVDLSAAPWRIQEMAVRWKNGKELSDLQAKQRGIIAQADAMVRGPGHDPAGDLSASQAATIDSKIRDATIIQGKINAVRARVIVI